MELASRTCCEAYNQVKVKTESLEMAKKVRESGKTRENAVKDEGRKNGGCESRNHCETQTKKDPEKITKDPRQSRYVKRERSRVTRGAVEGQT